MLRECLVLNLCISLVVIGCASPHGSGHEPARTGYGAVVVTSRDLVDTYTRRELHYWDTTGKDTLVWPHLYKAYHLENDLALFHGWLTTGPEDPDGPTRRAARHLFAAEKGGPAVDITDDVALMWARSTGTNLLECLKQRFIGSVARRDDVFNIEVQLWTGGGGTAALTSNDIVAMIQQAKEKGKQVKDPGFGTPYLKRNWEAELRVRKTTETNQK